MKVINVSFIVEIDDESKKDAFEKSLIKSFDKAKVSHEIKYVGQSAEELNRAARDAKGDIVCFSQTSCIYDENVIRSVVGRFNKCKDVNIVSALPVSYSKMGNVKFLHRSNEFAKHYDINIQEYEWNQFLFSLFISKSLVDRMSFDTKLKYEYKRAYIADLYSLESRYELVDAKVEATEGTELDYYNYLPKFEL